MNKKIRTNKKLSLNRKAIRVLDDADMQKAAGGFSAWPTGFNCPDSPASAWPTGFNCPDSPASNANWGGGYGGGWGGGYGGGWGGGYGGGWY